jgi:hypothetical protein
MAENIYLKTRVSKIEMCDPIAAAADLATAVWVALPLTLRDDEILIADASPEETEVFSHENDTAEDYDMVGKGTDITGSFINATRAQLVTLMGGSSVGADAAMRVHRSAKRILINKALKFTLTNGGDVIVPNAKGYVLLNAGLGYSGKTKYPFKFKALVAASDWDVDVIL